MKAIRFLLPLAAILLLAGCEYFFDTERPEVRFISPGDGEMAYLVVVRLEAKDRNLKSVELHVDGDWAASYDAGQVTDTLNLAEGSHVLKAIARDKGGNLSEVEVSVTVVAPGVPILLAPSNDTILGDSVVRLTWSKPLGAVEYRVQVDSGSGFLTPLFEADSIADTTWVLSGAGEGDYSWRVSAMSVAGFLGGWSAARAFAVAAPSAPELRQPSDDAILGDSIIRLTWSKSLRAVEYRVQVDSGTGFVAPLFEVDAIADTTWVLSGVDEGGYSWRVSARSAAGFLGGWSAARAFAVAAPLTPILRQPSDDAVVAEVSPHFDWDDPPRAAEYWLEVDDDSSFSSPAVRETALVASEYNCPAPLADGGYYWRAMARNAAGHRSAWSAPWRFFVWTTQGPPRLIAPPDGEVLWRSESTDFVWASVANATTYELQVCAGSVPAESLSFLLADTCFRWPSAYSGDVTWRVRAGRNNVWGTWSAGRSVAVLPYEVGFCYPPGYAGSVMVSGNYAYVADAGAGLRVIDVSDPQNPAEVGFYDTPGGAYGVAVAGSYAYVADGYEGLVVIDVSNPQNPFEAGYCNTPGSARGVAVAGNYAYVADLGRGLRVIDVSNPFSPSEAGFCDTPGYAYGVAVAGSYAYVADYAGGLRVIDVTDPQNPAEAGFCDTPGDAYSVAVSGNYAYVADGSDGLRVIDVSDPQNPAEEGFYDTPGGASGVAVAGSLAYVGDGSGGLRVVDVSVPQSPHQKGYCDTSGKAKDVGVVGSYAYVADGDGGLRVIRVKP